MMHANYIASRREMRKLAEEEARKQLEEFRSTECDKCQESLCYQAIATVLMVLHRQYGFGVKRLNDVKNATEDEFMRMAHGIPGMKYVRFTGVDYIAKLKEMGVELEVSQYG